MPEVPQCRKYSGVFSVYQEKKSVLPGLPPRKRQYNENIAAILCVSL